MQNNRSSTLLHLHNISIWFVKVVSVRILGICPVCNWTNCAVPDCTIPSSYWGKTFINTTLELESAIQQYQRAEAKLGGAVTTISKKVDTINQHIDKVLENAPTKLKVSVNVNDADRQKIQELFAKERQWMTAQMQMHIREVNSMFADERKKVRERYKEYDGCYLGHYAQWFFWFFFTIGVFVVAGGIGMMIAQSCGK